MSKKINFLRKVLIIPALVFALIIIFLNSSLNLYLKKNGLLKEIGLYVDYNEDGINDHHNQKRFLINPLETSDRQIPTNNFNDLVLDKDADIFGQWSAPIDWNVTAIHSVLLPDETVMTFGSFAIENKDVNKDLKSNKKITLTDGKNIGKR